MKCECGCGEDAKPGRRFINGHSNRGKHQSPETKQKNREWHLGRKHTPETREKIGKIAKDRIVSEETRKRISDTLKGRILTKEQIENARNGVRESWMDSRVKEKHSGKNHHNWKGGITPEEKQIRKSFEYQRWQYWIRKRDYYICQSCYSNKKIQVHHIKGFTQYPYLRLDVNNGITLCRECHLKTYGKEEQFEYLFQNTVILNSVLNENNA